MDVFPAFFPLHDKTVVIAGTGEAAEAKARLFAGSPATVVRVQGSVATDPTTYDGATLVFIADADDTFVKEAVAAARLVGALINVTDRPELCDFTTPAVIDRGEVVAAIGTGGASPLLAAMLRNDIEQQIPEGAGRVAALFRQYQDQVRSRIPDLAQRRAFLRTALSGPAAQVALAGDMAQAATLFEQALAHGAEALGTVQFVADQSSVDLLSLRASRALASADVLVIDPDTNPAIASMARRDAVRLEQVDASREQLAELLGQAKRIVRIGRPDPSWIKTLAAHGIVVEILPVAQEA